MAYLDDRPESTDALAVSQAILKENFAQLETQFSNDHDTLLSTGATGKHLKVTLPEQSSDPTTAADEGALYTKDSGTQTELYYREESDGDVIQITENGLVNTSIKAMVYFDAAGVIQGNAINVSSVTRTSTGHYTINFDTALPDTNYVVIADAEGLNPSVQISAKNTTDCDIIVRRPTSPENLPTNFVAMRK